ncbi:immunoglobulin superfamily member 6-like [Heterodontus francisci]|uniref:immunoglobulin superfamily member 6-like n=1 Tax=Heterodontus francisci TaxID=7792 RepID=UPI00355B4E68
MALSKRLGKILFLYLQAASLPIAGFAAQGCTVTVKQEPFIEQLSTNNMTIGCTFTAVNCSGSAKVLWFKINVNKTRNLCLGHCSSTETPGKFTLPSSISTGDATLRVQHVIHTDSGVYYCGVAFQSSSSVKSKQLGSGTTLVVREYGNSIMGSDLWLQSTLIIIFLLYAICITILLIQTIKATRQANSSPKHSSNDLNEEQKSQAFKELAREFNRKYRNKNQETTLQEAQTDCAQHDDTVYQNA